MQNTNAAIPVGEIERYVTHGYAENNGVKIHYASLGAGPLVVMVHGFPDYWYSWRHQMVALAPRYQVVALDLRGYNLSDKPKGGENYRMRYLISDIQAVIQTLGQAQAIIVGHDWGGAVSWQFAMHIPQMTERLVILNLPHPYALMRELANNPEQEKNSEYARVFQQEGSHARVTPESLLSWIRDPAVRDRYLEAYRRSDIEAMLHYYKQNYPRPPYQEYAAPSIKVQCSVLQIHGLKDPYLLPTGLNNTWQWVEKDWTLLTIPEAGHFVQHDAADLVSRTILSWLTR